MEAIIINIFNQLIGADFDKLCLAIGLLLLAIAIFCSGEVVIGSIRLPKIDVLGRALACVFAIALITLPLASYYLGTTIGLKRISQDPPPISPEKHSAWLIPEAYAKGQGSLLQTIEIKERHVIKLGDNIGNGELCLYVSNIHLKEPSALIVYRSTAEYLSDIKVGKEIKKDDILIKLKKDDIVVEADVKEGNNIKFNYKNTRYNLRVSKVIWYIFGSDFMEILISDVQ